MRIEKTDNRILLVIVSSLLILTFLLVSLAGSSNSIHVSANAGKASSDLPAGSIKYPHTLFDDSYVHNIDIQVDGQTWGKMIYNAEAEEYIPCTMVIDGVKIEKVGIRPKGNSSLKQISGMNSENFSFKVEFDHYTNQTFDGLDKMALNNCTQDTTYMKDYLTYHMMNYMGVAAPLTSFVNITLNGGDFGFYLAVEAVEQSFCMRNYKNVDGKLYKPDSLSLSNFNFAGIMNYKMDNGQSAVEYISSIMSGEAYKNADENTRVDMLGDLVKVILDASSIRTDVSGLVYVDDDPKSYKSIFDTAIFNTTESDKKRLINSIKKLKFGEDLENIIDIDSVIKFFVVHNFVDNYDGYTSIFSHNYYLHESNGKLSMVPWDYNLAFGSFTIDAANSFSDAFSDYITVNKETYGMSTGKSMVNYPIDTPVFTVDLEERPMIYQILSNKEYCDLYHKYFDEFISGYFESGYFDAFYPEVVEMISSYVKNDAKGFYTYEQFEDGAKELNKFCKLRAESIRGQLNGTIPATFNGQKEKPETLIDIQDLDIMKTLDFSTMVSIIGSSNEDINEILKTIIQYVPKKYLTYGKIDTSKITMDDVMSLKDNIGSIVPVVFQVIKNNNKLKKTVIDSATPVILLILSFIALVVLMILLNKYSRIKYKTGHRREKVETTA